MYNYLVWIILGTVVGAAFGLMRMRNEPNHDMTLDVFYGVIAAGIGGMLLSPLLGQRSWGNGDFSVASAVTAGLTALLVLAGMVLVRHRAAR